MINWRNIAENLILTLISVSVGVAIGYTISVQTAERMLDQQKSIIELAIKKETTSITNQVRTEIRKIKARRGAKIDLIIDPTMKSEIQQEETNNTQFVQPKKRTPFLKRLFNKEARKQHRKERRERKKQQSGY